MREREILLVGEVPEFKQLAKLMRDAGIDATHATAPDNLTTSACAVVCDVSRARTALLEQAAELQIPVVMIVNDRSADTVEGCLRAGATVCLARPLPLHVMLRSIANAIEQ